MVVFLPVLVLYLPFLTKLTINSLTLSSLKTLNPPELLPRPFLALLTDPTSGSF